MAAELKQLRWGILSTGNIARKCVKGMAGSETATPLAVSSRELSKARAFADELGIERAYGNYQELLADPDVDAVYVATPHPMHHDDAIAACEAGKHVLCEKPMGMNEREVVAMLAAAKAADVFFIEAFRYRFHPQTIAVCDLIKQGAIGQVRSISASYGFFGPDNPDGRLLNHALGGGGIMDVGCYPLSMVRLLAGAAQGKPFADPTLVHGVAHLGTTGVDEYASALMKFDAAVVADIHTGVRLNRANDVTVFGEGGHIHLAWPWNPELGAERATLTLARLGQEPEVRQVTASKGLWAYEVDEVARYVHERQSPAMSWDDSLGNARALDAWRQSIGLRYAADDC